MFKYFFFVIIFTVLTSNTSAEKTGNESGAFEQCREKAMALRPGQVIKVELKQENDKDVYEFDIRDEENRDWDIECAAASGEIVEIEEEIFGVNDPRFREQMKIGYSEAKAIALKQYPGEIIEIEYELEASGLAVFEFDILQASGREMKLEINARTGELHESSIEIWQVGYE